MISVSPKFCPIEVKQSPDAALLFVGSLAKLCCTKWNQKKNSTLYLQAFFCQCGCHDKGLFELLMTVKWYGMLPCRSEKCDHELLCDFHYYSIKCAFNVSETWFDKSQFLQLLHPLSHWIICDHVTGNNSPHQWYQMRKCWVFLRSLIVWTEDSPVITSMTLISVLEIWTK